MQDFFCDLWTNQTLRYIAATAFGFVLAVVGEQVNKIIDRRRLRQSVREALASELITNLRMMDSYVTIFRKNVLNGGSSWPLGRLETIILERTLDPNINSILTNVEQVQAAVAFQQCRAINSELDSVGEDVMKFPHLIKSRSQFKLDYQLMSVGQNLTDLLINVLTRQRVFASSEPAAMVGKLQPLFKSRSLDSKRIWRTSSVPLERWTQGSHIAWFDDMDELPPKGVSIVELQTIDVRNYVQNIGERSWYMRFIKKVNHSRELGQIEKQSTRLATTIREDLISPNQLSTVKMKDKRRDP